jgi:hypothetical protein
MTAELLGQCQPLQTGDIFDYLSYIVIEYPISNIIIYLLRYYPTRREFFRKERTRVLRYS